jgi:hypothetical protein
MGAELFGLAVVLGIGAMLYMLPTIIAWSRRIESRGWVLVLNILLGWSGIVYFICLWMALSSPPRHRYQIGEYWKN